MSTDREFYTTKEAAALLGVPYFTLVRRAQRGSIEAHKIGWIWVFPKEVVDRATNSETVEGSAG